MNPLGAILRLGVHVPRLRLPRAVIAGSIAWANSQARGATGERAICNWDEDALTLAVEAARGFGPASGGAPIASVLLCSTSAPFADRDNAGLLASALALDQALETMNLGGSLRAATTGLANAAHRKGALSLVLASEARPTRAGSAQELSYGDAAVAMLVGPTQPGALATVLATMSVSSDFVDHYRMSEATFDYALEERWVRDESLAKLVPRVTAELLARAGVGADAIRHLILPTSAATAKRLAAAAGLGQARREERLPAECGDAGVALPPLMLAAVLEVAAAGDLILLVGLGQGIDALLLRAEPGAAACGKPLTGALARRREEPSYVRYLSHRGLLEVDFGMRAERDQRTAHTVAYRKREVVTAFTGGRCQRCGTVQFPLSRVCVAPDCRASDTQAAHRLADSRGRVKSFTEDWQAYAARPPYVYGNVEFAEGGNLLMEFTDVEPGELAVGDAVRFVFRIKDEDRARQFRRYFWKATKA